MARPKAVDMVWAETMVSSGDIAPDRGRRARVLVTPAVIFSCVNEVPRSCPSGVEKKETVKTSVGATDT